MPVIYKDSQGKVLPTPLVNHIPSNKQGIDTKLTYTSVKLDKFSCTYKVNTDEEREAIREAILQLHKQHKYQNKTIYPYKYSHRFLIASGHKNNWLDVSYDFKYKEDTKAFIRFEFNPRTIDRGALSSFFQYVFFMGVEPARLTITRLGVAIDIPGHPRDYLIDGKGFHVESSINSTKGYDTVYIGTENSGLQVSVYNKTEEQESKGFKMKEQVTRLEFRFKYEALSLNGPVNSFERVRVYSYSPTLPVLMEAKIKPYNWYLFLDSCALRGCGGALKILPAYQRAIYRNALDSSSATWWNPDSIYTQSKLQFHELLSSIGLVHSSALKCIH